MLSIIFVAIGCTILFCANVHADEERKPSMFKVGEEWMALPEVFSNLDFEADSTPAGEHDIENQMRLRSTRYWGRIYIDGWPQSIQFFRAHFGNEPPIGKKRFVYSEPRDACSDLTNAHLLTADHILIVNRGNCTFGTKAKTAQKTASLGIVIVNNEPGLDHLPGPDAHDIQYFVSSIPQSEGQLLEAVYDEGPPSDGFGRRLDGFVVPINCENNGATCVPATFEERRYVKELNDGGILSVGSSTNSNPVEYLLAHFGTKVLDESVALPVTVARPAEACSAIENDVKGKIVLVRRGSCPFVKKAEEVQAAGGRAMVVGSLFPYIVRMGVEPRWKGLNTAIPVVMVSKRSYSTLVAESYSGGLVSFHEDKNVSNAVWEPLEKLSNGEGWPRSETYIKKKYEELLEQHADWPDRVETVVKAYAKHFGNEASSGSDHSEL